MTAHTAPTNDRGIQDAPRMKPTPRSNESELQTIRPTTGGNSAGYVEHAAEAAADVVRNMHGNLKQENLGDIADLLKLQDTNPEEFARYVQLAADAAKLAEEHPEVFRQLMQDNVSDEGNLSAARAEQKRAMDAIFEQAGTKSGIGSDEKGGIHLPGGRTLGPGGMKDAQAGILITPCPAFVFKTKLVDVGMKVFVNVCQHELIGDLSIVKKLDDTGQEVQGVNIPLSVGPPSVAKDNAGQECIVYDVVVNPMLIEGCQRDKTGVQRNELCHMAMRQIMSKYKCCLDPKYKLPKLTFKGDKSKGPAEQRIRDESLKPQIRELEGNGSKADSSSSNSNSNSTKAREYDSAAERTKGPLGQATAMLPPTSLTWTITVVRASQGGEVRDSQATIKDLESDLGAMSLEGTVRIPVDQWPDMLVVTAAGLRKEALAPSALDKVDVQVSAYECSVKVSSHHPLQVRLPYAVLPDTASAQANSHDGTVAVSFSVDKRPPSRTADAGSKPWLLASALEDEEGGVARREVELSGVGSVVDIPLKAEASANDVKDSDEDTLPEDRFHLKLPKGVNQYTGVAEGDETSKDVNKLLHQGKGADDNQGQGQDHDRYRDLDGPVSEGDSLPEERFHRADIVSQHMIDTREKQRNDKIARAEEERAARKKQPADDGVEYVDLDDYRTGGKYGPSPTNTAAGVDTSIIQEQQRHDPELSQDMATATRVLSEVVQEKEAADGGDGASIGSRLSATFWADLLD